MLPHSKRRDRPSAAYLHWRTMKAKSKETISPRLRFNLPKQSQGSFRKSEG